MGGKVQFVTRIAPLIMIVLIAAIYGMNQLELSGGWTIVICESSWLLGGWGEVYQIYEDNTAGCIGDFSTDDGYRNRGAYEIDWGEEGVTISFEDEYKSDSLRKCYYEWVDE